VTDDRAGASDEPRRREDLRADPQLLEMLVCPVTRNRLDYDAERQELVSKAAGLAFPIHDGIPVMLADEARRLD